MGHKQKNLKMQCNDALTSACAFGSSKHKAKQNGTAASSVFSFSTFKTYKQQSYYFAEWCKEMHPEAKTLAAARQYVGEWLQLQIARDLSPYTVRTAASAMAKIYGCTTADFGVKMPARSRENITRSRGRAKRDSGFNEAQNAELCEFLRSTGLRRACATALRGSWLRITEEGVFIDLTHTKATKGGRPRLVPVHGDVDLVVRLCTEAGEGKVFPGGINSHCDVHSYRAEYCARAYLSKARDVKTLKRSELYHCRKASAVYDREALRYASACLGHNRIEIAPGNYMHALDKVQVSAV